jgi:hypothetical protein
MRDTMGGIKFRLFICQVFSRVYTSKSMKIKHSKVFEVLLLLSISVALNYNISIYQTHDALKINSEEVT